MFNDLLKTRRDGFTLLEWAGNGWLAELARLDVFSIALLAYPYVRIDREENPDGYTRTEAEFKAFCDTLLIETKQGGLPEHASWCGAAHPTDTLYSKGTSHSYHVPFIFDPALYHYEDRKADSNNAFHLYMWAQSSRREFKAFKFPREVPIIARDEFKQWLIRKGKWPVSPDSLLSRWFDGCGGITENESDGNSFGSPAKEAKTHKPFVYDLKRKDEITDVLINAIEQCRNGNDFPKFLDIWRYFTKTPSMTIGLFTIEISAEKDRITIDKRIIDKAMLRSRFNNIKKKLVRD